MLRAMNMRTYGHNDPDVLHPTEPAENTGIAGGLGLDNQPPKEPIEPAEIPQPPDRDPVAKDSALELLLKVIRDA